MLPGFRILFAAFVLSFSILIFGLGAAALLRSAHEEFVGIPSWRAAQQPLMPATDTGRPSLAMLRVEPAPTKPEAAKREIVPASIDTQATEKTVAVEKPAAEASKPRVRRAKRTRSVKTIRHWRAPRTVSQQPDATLAFSGFEAQTQPASSGTSRNGRAASNSPF